MLKKNIIIAGSGFAGVSAFRRLHKYNNVLKDLGYSIVLIDEKDNFEFRPMLPDIIGGWMKPERLLFPIHSLANRLGGRFVQKKINRIDAKEKNVHMNGTIIPYEYLIISTGSCTNFFNNQDIQRACLKLDSVEDAIKIKEQLLFLSNHHFEVRVVIIGSGYTGIEIATNIVFLFKQLKTSRCHVTLLEKAPDILTGVPKWIRTEVRRELTAYGIDIVCNDSIKSWDETSVTCESGKTIKAHLCLWTAGVKASPCLDTFASEKDKTRIKVDRTLRVKNSGSSSIFVTGDSAAFLNENTAQTIRMAVMFSIGQGKIAAENVVRSILSKPLLKFKVRDLGYLVPMAHGKASGVVLNKRIHGFLGYMLHYIMCIYRSEWKNKLSIFHDLFKKTKSFRFKKGV